MRMPSCVELHVCVSGGSPFPKPPWPLDHDTSSITTITNTRLGNDVALYGTRHTKYPQNANLHLLTAPTFVSKGRNFFHLVFALIFTPIGRQSSCADCICRYVVHVWIQCFHATALLQASDGRALFHSVASGSFAVACVASESFAVKRPDLKLTGTKPPLTGTKPPLR